MYRGLLPTSWFVLMVVAGLAPDPSTALACGNYSHVWIAGDAVNYLQDGELKDLLSEEARLEKMRNGAMYPDGGYAVGDGYGETSHWEPFHLTYLEWIRAEFEPPWSDEAAGHIAFLLGMAAHGIGDQLYDGMYLERHQYYDENGSGATLFGVDGATDTCFAATQGYMEPPVKWLPAETLAPLYEKLSGHMVTAETLEKGHDLVVIAIMYANSSHDNPAILGEYMELYPWACSNQDNPAAPGSPPTIGPAVAAYWNVLWGTLHGDGAGFDKPLAATYFTGGTPYEQPQDASTPDSWVSFMMPRGLDASTVSTDTVVVTTGGGDVHPVKLHVYYGSNSHLVNVKPMEDWADNTDYTVTVSPPISAWDGAPLLESESFIFSTGLEPPPPTPEATSAETSDVVSSDVASGADAVELITADEVDVTADTTGSGRAAKSGCSSPAGSRLPSASGIVLVLLSLCALTAFLRVRTTRGS